ncbi:MAG: DUF447 family protein [Candidatus Bathyarchaeota archaeon]
MINLTDLGFQQNMIGETIVTTFDSKRNPNAAPMGVVVEGTEQLLIRPYLTSSTFQNLRKNGYAVVNLTSDPRIFYKTAFKDKNLDKMKFVFLFEEAETIDAPRLKIADAVIEVSVAKQDLFNSERAEILCNIKYVKTSNILPTVYCRAQFATIEAIIYSTRIEAFINGNDQQERLLIQIILKL